MAERHTRRHLNRLTPRLSSAAAHSAHGRAWVEFWQMTGLGLGLLGLGIASPAPPSRDRTEEDGIHVDDTVRRELVPEIDDNSRAVPCSPTPDRP